MIVLGIDPGPTHCGVVLYDSTAKHVLWSFKDDSVSKALATISLKCPPLVAIERVQSTGQAGASLFRTCEVVGRLQQRAMDSGLPVVLLYRREVCSALHVHGAGKDAQVRRAMIEMHGGSKQVAVGTKKSPGALHGVASHAWQALGLAFVAAQLHSRS
mgnify:CR=1 FL=1|jgi:Holliday junction resolvasome RuvABC endonuclease subunit